MSNWLRDERSDFAAGRILDAAAKVFVNRGVAATGMADVAKAAGCSRATLYRYFENRRALHLAFVHREARRIGDLVAREVAGIADPGALVVEAMLAAVRLVRSEPTLAAWFQLGDAGIATEIANSSAVIEALSTAFVANVGLAGEKAPIQARWLVRAIVSLLAIPGIDDADERAMLEQCVAPMARQLR